MMIDPPIDKLIEKVGCKYALVVVNAKRARYLLDKQEEALKETGASAVTAAAKELYDGKVIAAKEE